MSLLCHRCGSALTSADELFCPHCGAPQLRYEPSEDGGTTYVSPPPAGGRRGSDTISWKTAVACAFLVAVPVAVLSSMLDFSSIWVIGGGVATVSIYRRRIGVPPSGKMGWRIGALLGIFAGSLSTAFYSIKLLVERHMLHSSELDQQIHLFTQQFAEQVNKSDPQTAAAMAELNRFWLSPDGAAAIVLGGAAMTILFTILFAAAGGAIGARITTLGSTRARHSS